MVAILAAGLRHGLVFLVSCVLVVAAETEAKKLLPPGTPREEVIDTYGWPTGQSKLGTREILSYPQGTVTLEDDRVTAVNFNLKQPWPTPRPRPSWAQPRPDAKDAVKTLPVPPAKIDGWTQQFDEGLKEAAQRNLPILLLLLAPESSAAGRQFDEEVARHPTFVAAFKSGLVLVRVDLSAQEGWPVEVKARHLALPETLKVKAFPSLRLLAPEGAVRAEFDLAQIPAGEGFREGVISAVRAARNHVFRHLPDPSTVGATPKSGPEVSAQSAAWDTSLLKARGMVIGSIALGFVIAGLLFWVVWHQRKTAEASTSRSVMAQRISDAASGLPSQVDFNSWPRQRLVALMAGFVEAEGYQAEVRTDNGDWDISLRRAGSERAQSLILCSGSEVGVVSAKRLKEFYGTLAAEGVDNGWYVAPAGFAEDAKVFAAGHGMQLFDGPALTGQLRELPPLVLPKVLARAMG
jgi:hypothetical protein